MAIDGFQLIQGLADRMVIVERQLSRIDVLESKVKAMTCSHGSAIQRHYNEIKELRALVKLLKTPAKNEPKEPYKFAHIDEVLLRHKAVNKPKFGWHEIHLSPYRFITVRLVNDQFLVKLRASSDQTDIALLMTEDASQVDIFIQAQKGNI